MHFVHPVIISSNQNYCIAYYAFGRHTHKQTDRKTCTQAHTHTYKPSAKILPICCRECLLNKSTIADCIIEHFIWSKYQEDALCFVLL